MRAIIALISLLISCQLSTQLLAYQVEYDALLGKSIIGNLYAPWSYFKWLGLFGKYIPKIFVISALPMIFIVILLIIIGLINNKKVLNYHGEARWAKSDEIKNMGFFPKSGVVCGLYEYGFIKKETFLNLIPFAFFPESKRLSIKSKAEKWLLTKGTKLGLYRKKYIKHKGKEHMIVFAPTRSGKGVGLIIPTLLGEWKESCIVTDIKGENWGITAGYRKKMGQKVIKFDPTCNDGSTARFNPMEEIRFGTEFEIQDIQNIAGILVDPEGKGDKDHWKMSAENLLVGLICHMAYAYAQDPQNNPKLTLSALANLLKNSVEEVINEAGEKELKCKGFFTKVDELATYEHFTDGLEMEIFDLNFKSPTYGKYVKTPITVEKMRKIYPEAQNLKLETSKRIHPICFNAFVDIASKAENERASIVSTANAILGIYADPILARNTYTSDFKIWDLMNNDDPVSLYLITPPSDIDRIQPVFRLTIEMIVRQNVRSMEFDGGQAIKIAKHNCLLLLDEFPALGRMDAFEKELAYIAGYGLKAFMICQGFPQLQKTYTKENSIVTNCHIQIYYAPNDDTTANMIKDGLGTFTEEVKTKSGNAGWFTTKNISQSFISRPLMMPDEAKRMGDKEIIIMTGQRPIITEKVKYYLDSYFTSKLCSAPEKADTIYHEKCDLKKENEQENSNRKKSYRNRSGGIKEKIASLEEIERRIREKIDVNI